MNTQAKHTINPNTKRVAKNTLLLYLRMIILMLVSLYTSRVILDGIVRGRLWYVQRVGGMVAMFLVLSGRCGDL